MRKRSLPPTLVLLASFLCSAVLPSFGQPITPSPTAVRTPTATPASVPRGTLAPNNLNQTPVTIRDNVDLSLVCPARALYNLVIDSIGGIHCTRNIVLPDGESMTDNTTYKLERESFFPRMFSLAAFQCLHNHLCPFFGGIFTSSCVVIM